MWSIGLKMENLDVQTLLALLKQHSDPANHLYLENLYHHSMANQSPENGEFVLNELIRLCGKEMVDFAIKQAVAAKLRHDSMEEDQDEDDDLDCLDDDDEDDDEDDENENEDDDEEEEEDDQFHSSNLSFSMSVPFPSMYPSQNVTSMDVQGAFGNSMDRPSGLDYEGDYDDDDSNENGTIEVSEASHRAWNHCVNCRDLNCRFKLCKKIRPYVEHRRKLQREGIHRMCKESCTYCLFQDSLSRRVIPRESMTRKEKREHAKEKRLVQTYAALLLAHHQAGGDEQVRELYNHMMGCMVENCKYRVGDIGSCASSRALMYHLKKCKSANTKTCNLCCELPPKVKRMKKKPRSLPMPAFVKKLITEERNAKQRENKRIRLAKRKMEQEGQTVPMSIDGLNSDQLARTAKRSKLKMEVEPSF